MIEKQSYLESLSYEDKEIQKAYLILFKNFMIGSDGSTDVIKKYCDHKIRHTIGVLDSLKKILDKTKDRLPIELENKIKIASILHDLGRFHQNDKKNILKGDVFEHADYGYEIAKKEGYSEDICLAIKYHNKKEIIGVYNETYYLELNSEYKKELIFIINIVRDADKLGNLIYNSSKKFRLTHNYNDFISKEIIESFNKKELSENNSIKSNIDKVLRELLWIFDINNEETYKLIEQYGIIDKFYSVLDDIVRKEQVNILDKIKEIVNNELKR